MKPRLALHAGLAVAAIGVACILAMPSIGFAAQQDRASAGGGATASGGGAGAGGGGSSGATSSSGGDRGSGGGSFGAGSSGGSGTNRAGAAGATGGSGVAMPRGGSGDHSGGGISPRYTGSGGSNGTRATGRTRDETGEPSGVPRYSRPRDPNEPSQGTAVPRPPNSTPTRGGGTGYLVPGGGYYGGYGLGYPYGGGYFGGYYDPWYDPWYGGYPGYGGGGGYVQTFSDEGALRLKIKPQNAEVYVDGYYVGIVDEFDGTFQRLHIDSGPHRVEVRAAGYEPLTFEVRIVADRKTTYQGEMHRIQ